MKIFIGYIDLYVTTTIPVIGPDAETDLVTVFWAAFKDSD